MKKALLIVTAVFSLAAAGFAVSALTTLKIVNIRSTGFGPKTVTIAGGDTVRWKNVDTVNHQVVANNGAFASPIIRPTRTYSKVLDTPGTYPYHDGLHPLLKGTVKVVGPPPAVSIGASVGIATFSTQIHIGGAVTPPAVGNTVSIFAQPTGSASFVKLADVQTTTNGVWDYVTSPEILTAYKATWKGKTSAIIMVAVAPKLTLRRVSGWFVARALPSKFGGHWVYVQRQNRFGQWVTLRKVTFNQQSARRFKMRRLARGRHRLRIFMTTNQAGPGYIFSASSTLVFRKR